MSSRPQIGSDPGVSEYVELRQYLEVLRRHRRFIVLVVLLCLLVASLYTFLRTPEYTASAKVVVRPTLVNLEDVASSGPSKVVSLPTESEVMTSTDVAALAAERMGSSVTPQGLLRHVEVSIPTDAQVLAVSYTDPDPRVAQRGAIALAESYLAFRQTQAEGEIARRRAVLDARIGELQAEISRLNQIIAERPDNSAAVRDAQAQRDQILGQMTVYQTQLADVETLNTDPGDLVSRPLVPGHPSSPNHLFDLGVGLLLGLFSASVGALVLSRLDQRLRERTTLEDIVGVPVLAVIPRIREWRDREAPMLVTVEEPKSPATEAYRALRPALLVAAARQNVKIIMVVSPLAGEGKTTTAANLAVVLAQADKRVWLVSADLRKPRIHEFFGVDNERGLVSVLSGESDAWEVTEQASVANLWILPSGPLPTNPSELLQSEAMRTLLRKESEMFDFVILDCPPVLAVADSLGLASSADAVLFVADAASTKRDAVTQAREQLEQVGAPLLAAVLNDLAVDKSKYYGYGYGYQAATKPASPGRAVQESAPRQDAAAS